MRSWILVSKDLCIKEDKACALNICNSKEKDIGGIRHSCNGNQQDLGAQGGGKGCIPRQMALTKVWKSKNSSDVCKEHQVAEFNCDD